MSKSAKGNAVTASLPSGGKGAVRNGIDPVARHMAERSDADRGAIPDRIGAEVKGQRLPDVRYFRRLPCERVAPVPMKVAKVELDVVQRIQVELNISRTDASVLGWILLARRCRVDIDDLVEKQLNIRELLQRHMGEDRP